MTLPIAIRLPSAADTSRRRFFLGSATRVGLTALATTLASTAQASEAAGPARAYEFLPLGDFTVNLPSTGRRHQYFLVSITIEVKADQVQAFRDLSPRLKEAVLQQLMRMSERQQLRPGGADPAAVREALFASLVRVQEEGLKSVVITRMMHS